MKSGERGLTFNVLRANYVLRAACYVPSASQMALQLVETVADAVGQYTRFGAVRGHPGELIDEVGDRVDLTGCVGADIRRRARRFRPQLHDQGPDVVHPKAAPGENRCRSRLVFTQQSQ